MFPLNSNTPYIKDTGERARLGQIVGGGADTPELPDYSVSDAGKVLTVGEDGSLEWDTKGSGGGDYFLLRDFTKEPSRTIDNVTYSQDGAQFNTSGSSFLKLLVQESSSIRDFTMYLDIPELTVDATLSSHQRFLMGTPTIGLIFESVNHSWGFYGSSWEYTGNTDPELFNNCTVKLYVDANGKWHIYKNGVLLFESNQAITTWSVQIGSNQNSIKSALFTGARFYNGDYTE